MRLAAESMLEEVEGRKVEAYAWNGPTGGDTKALI